MSRAKQALQEAETHLRSGTLGKDPLSHGVRALYIAVDALLSEIEDLKQAGETAQRTAKKAQQTADDALDRANFAHTKIR